MADAKKKPQLRTPGPIWLWMVIAVLFAQVGKRAIGGWPLPKQFNFGSRFFENFVANLVWGLPVLAVLAIATIWMNRRSAS